MGIKNLDPLLKSIKFRSNKFSNLEKFLVNNLKEIKKNWPKKLPNGIIHGDLFIDNIFFNKNKFQELLIFILLQMIILCMKLLFVLTHYVLIIKNQNLN